MMDVEDDDDACMHDARWALTMMMMHRASCMMHLYDVVVVVGSDDA